MKSNRVITGSVIENEFEIVQGATKITLDLQVEANKFCTIVIKGSS